MMLTPRCPDHGPLVLDLALGRLDDAEALRAEQVRYDCDSCREWWSENLQGEAVATVHAAVVEVFSSFAVPRRRRSHVWWVAAAAAVVVLSVGLTWHLGPSGTPADPPSAATVDVPTPANEAITVFGFESGSLAEIQRGSAEVTTLRTASVVTQAPVARVAAEHDPEQAVFVGNFEAGGLDAWTPDA